MSRLKFLPYAVDYHAMRGFSQDGDVYRAFGYLILPRHGSILLVPPVVVQGRFGQLVDGCPVPWEEVAAIIERETEPFMLNLVDMEAMERHFNALDSLGLDRSGWVFDLIGIHDERRNVLRFIHISGVRYAVTNDFNKK